MRLGYEQTWLSGLAELDQLQSKLKSECSDLSDLNETWFVRSV